MRRYLKPWLIDTFIRNVALLASGTMISQLIILITLPLLTRLYTPAEYGAYSMYISVIGMLLMLVSCAYENAITLPEDDRTASAVTGLSLLICAGVSLASGLTMALLQKPLAAWLPGLPQYYMLFALSLLGVGSYQILSCWSIRKKYFRQLARTKYTQSLGQVSSQLALSLTHLGPLGLIAGDIIGRSGGLIPQWRLWLSDMRRQAIRLDWSSLKDAARRYRRFPQLSLVSNILNSVCIYLPTVLLASFYGAQMAGLFALGQRILGSPMTLIMTSVRNVYLAESSEYITSDPARLVPLFRKTALHVLAAGLLIVAVFVGIAPYAFSFLFGEQWRQSADLIRLMSVMYLSQFVANSVGTTIDVMERQDLHLLREVVRTFIILGALLAAGYTHQSAETAVLMFSAASTLGYLLHLGLSWHAIRKYGKGAGERGTQRQASHALTEE